MTEKTNAAGPEGPVEPLVGRLRRYGDGLPVGILLMREAADEVERLTAALVEADSENQREQAEKFRALQPRIDYVRGQLSDIVEDCDTALNRDKTAHEAEVLGIREVAKQALASSLFDLLTPNACSTSK